MSAKPKYKITVTDDLPSGTVTREHTASTDAELLRIRAKLHATAMKGSTRTVVVK